MPVLMTSIPRVVKRQVLSSTRTTTSNSVATTSTRDDDADNPRLGGTTGNGDSGGILGPIFGGGNPTPTSSRSRGGLFDFTLFPGASATSSSTSSSSASTSSVSSTISTTSSSTSTSASSTEASSASVFESSSNGQIITITTFVPAPAATDTQNATLSNNNVKSPPKSFLQNKPLSGFVFALCGLLGLVMIVMIATCALRRRQRKKLLNEAISFDPASMTIDPYSPSKAEGGVGLQRSDSTEKRMSISSSGHGHDGLVNAAYGGVAGGGINHTTYGVPNLTYGAPPAVHHPQYHQAAYAEHQTAYAEHHGYYGQDQSQTQWYPAAHAQQGWYDQGQYSSYANYAQPEPPSSAAPVSAGLASATAVVAAVPPTPRSPVSTSRSPVPTPKTYTFNNPPTLPQLNFISASPPTPGGHAGVLNSPMLASARRASSMLVSARTPSTPTFTSVARSATVASSSPYSSSSPRASTETVTNSNSSSSSSAEGAAGGVTSPTKHGRSHSRELDPALPSLPLSPVLPAKFGRDEDGKRGSVHEGGRYLGGGTLKIANE